jgi:hypothetical protein
MYYMLTCAAFPALVGAATSRGHALLQRGHAVIDDRAIVNDARGSQDSNHGPDVRSRRDPFFVPLGDVCDEAPISFDEYVQQHGRRYKSGSKEYGERKALFEKRAAEARAHNCRPGKRFWTAGLTSLSDRTEQELARLRGRKGGFGEGGQPSTSGGRATSERLAAVASSEVSLEHVTKLSQT